MQFHVTVRNATAVRKGVHLASFRDLAHALSYAHNRRAEYKSGCIISVWFGADMQLPNFWTNEADLPCTGI